MKTVRLARIAAEAETLRLRRIARRIAIRAAFAVVCAVFALAVLAMLHATGWLWAATHFGSVVAALIVLGVDVVLCIIFGVLAARSGTDRIEQEALHVRQTAVQQIGQSLALIAMLRPVTRRARTGGLLGRLFATAVDTVLRR